MKKLRLLTAVLSLVAGQALAQTDTIFTNNEKIACQVREITEDAVKFVYPGEDVPNSLYKNSILKIVFKSGRVQTFSQATTLPQVNNVDDFDKVTVTAVEGEIKGLYKLGDVSAKAVGTTELSNQERVKKRAYNKLKIQAALMGANIVFLTHQRTEGNRIGYWESKSAETNLSGVAYTNILPDYEAFAALIREHESAPMSITQEAYLSNTASDLSKYAKNKEFRIEGIENSNGLILVNGDYRVTSFDDKGFNLYQRTKSKSSNFRIEFGQ